MNKKDEKIQYELKSMSDGNLPDADKILYKARAEMRSREPAKKRVFGASGFFAFAAAVAAIVFIIVFGSRLGNIFVPGKSDGSDKIPSPSGGHYYTATDIYARNATFSEASEIFAGAYGNNVKMPLSDIINDTGYEISGLNIYVFRDKNTGKDVMMEFSFRIRTAEYGNDEICVRFELTENTYEGNSPYLKLPYMQDKIWSTEMRENGEYVSRAYLENKYRCMLQIMNGNSYRLEHYLDILFNI